MADLVRKYERIATESAPPTPSKSTSKRAMSFVVPEESPILPSSPPATGPTGGCVAGERLPRFRYDQLRSAFESRESSNKRKRFLGAEAKNLKIETEDKTCTDGNLRRETPSLDAGQRPDVQPPQPSPAADDDEAKVKSTCTAEIEAYLSAMEREQHGRFAEKYNYDVVNDAPLQGRYEWIPLNVGAVEETLK